MKIAVLGTGYVGLVSGTCFAETGNFVSCVDTDSEKVAMLTSGQITIYEPGLEDIFSKNVGQKRLSFSTDLKSGIADAEIIFLALPTPQSEDGTANLDYVTTVAGQLGPLLKSYTVIVNKSTVPVGTSELLTKIIQKNTKVPFDVISNPEFLREGRAVDDFMRPERIIIGTSSEKAKKIMQALYSPYVRQGNPIIFMDERSAELTKYAANAFLATKISFINEMANLCEKLNANIDLVRLGMGMDSRIGRKFLFPGIGFGGSCFPKDLVALSKTATENQYDFKILKAVMSVNADQKTKLIQAMRQHLKELKGKVIAVWGLAFKPHTDDIREAPSLENIEQLLLEGAVIRVHDPKAMENVKEKLGTKISFYETPQEATVGADAIFIATEWPEYRMIDFNSIGKNMRGKAIFDGRNLYNLDDMRGKGFTYVSIGRQSIHE